MSAISWNPNRRHRPAWRSAERGPPADHGGGAPTATTAVGFAYGATGAGMAAGQRTESRAMNRRTITAWGLTVALAPALAQAEAEQLKGTRFIDVMQNNTLSGTTADGASYNLYFLPGGEITYDDSSGERDRGRWSMDPDGDVCVSFEHVDDGRTHCYQVEIDGRHVTWTGKGGDGSATLRGGVTESFLKSE
jgi:hypothetical protein